MRSPDSKNPQQLWIAGRWATSYTNDHFSAFLVRMQLTLRTLMYVVTYLRIVNTTQPPATTKIAEILFRTNSSKLFAPSCTTSRMGMMMLQTIRCCGNAPFARGVVSSLDALCIVAKHHQSSFCHNIVPQYELPKPPDETRNLEIINFQHIDRCSSFKMAKSKNHTA